MDDDEFVSAAASIVLCCGPQRLIISPTTKVFRVLIKLCMSGSGTKQLFMPVLFASRSFWFCKILQMRPLFLTAMLLYKNGSRTIRKNTSGIHDTSTRKYLHFTDIICSLYIFCALYDKTGVE